MDRLAVLPLLIGDAHHEGIGMRHTEGQLGGETTMAVATTPSDIDLLQDARAGNQSAFTELYVRHRSAALRVARCYGANGDGEDIVNTAFERVMAAVRRGGGPIEAFRPYLYVTVRHLAMERATRVDHESLDDLPEAVVAGAELPAVDASERELVLEAFAGLPDRWQAILWQVAVEGRPPREVARTSGLPANTVAVLAHRARERLRQTYLQAHVHSSGADRCRPHRARLGAYVRGGLSPRQRDAADEHLATCESCRGLVAELDDVNRLLARSVLPVFALAGEGGLVAGPGAIGTGGLSAGVGGSATGAGAASGGAMASGAGLASGAALASGATATVGLGTGVFCNLAAATSVVFGLVAMTPPHDSGASRGDTLAIEIQHEVTLRGHEAMHSSEFEAGLSAAISAAAPQASGSTPQDGVPSPLEPASTPPPAVSAATAEPAVVPEIEPGSQPEAGSGIPTAASPTPGPPDFPPGKPPRPTTDTPATTAAPGKPPRPTTDTPTPAAPGRTGTQPPSAPGPTETPRPAAPGPPPEPGAPAPVPPAAAVAPTGPAPSAVASVDLDSSTAVGSEAMGDRPADAGRAAPDGAGPRSSGPRSLDAGAGAVGAGQAATSGTRRSGATSAPRSPPASPR